MTIEDGRFVGDTKDEILDQLIAAAEEAFGREFTPDEVSVIRAFYGPVAEYLTLQQGDIREVMDSSQLEHAEGQALDMLTALIGVYRNDAEPAVAQQQFERESRVEKTYTIPQGTRVQTDETDPSVFETTEKTSLHLLDDFEDDNIDEYDGDSSGAGWVTGISVDSHGDYGLIGGDAPSRIYRMDKTVSHGSRFHLEMGSEANGAGAFLFGVQDYDNYYRVVFDHEQQEITIGKREGGAISTLATDSLSLDADTYYTFQIDWNFDGGFDVLVEDSLENEITTLSATESTQTWERGGFGFEAVTGTGIQQYWDWISMSRVTIPVESVDAGAETNIGKNTLTIFRSQISGVDSTTNIRAGTGGRDSEDDDEFRERAADELSEGMAATLPAVIKEVGSVPEVKDLAVFVNDSASQDGDGRPSHSFEVVADVPASAEKDVARAILHSKAMGDIDTSGHVGTSVSYSIELLNGQTETIEFSKPTELQIYIDCDLTKTETYEGDNEVEDNIIQYIGGTLNSGGNVSGDISVGDDVIYNKVLDAIMSINGVHDVTNLEIGTSSDPTGTSNISVGEAEAAFINSNDGSVDITSSDL